MKRIKWLLSMTALSLAVVLSCSSCFLTAESQNPTRPEGMIEEGTTVGEDQFVTMMENDQLTFQINQGTTDIKVIDKRTGYVWSSEGNFDGQKIQGEVLNLSYYDNSGSVTEIDSYTECVAKGQYAITQPQSNQVKVQYSIGTINKLWLCPVAMSPERYQTFYSKMTPDQQLIMDSYYYLVDFESENWKARPPEEQADGRVEYPLARNHPWYYPTPNLNDDGRKIIHEIMVSIGYTEEDYAIDNEGTGYEQPEEAEFNINVYYELDGADLLVTIPEKEIYHSKNFIIEKFELLGQLLSVDKNQTGYYLLPDGSGSIMNFYNGTQQIRNDNLYIPIYGLDDSTYVMEKTAENPQAVFPVFGANVGSSGCFAIIEEGEAFAGLTAMPGDDTVPPQLFVDFRINEKARIRTVTSTADQPAYFNMFQFQRYLGDIKVRYKFLAGENATYSGMAKTYQSYLFGDEAPMQKTTYPMTAEVISTIDVKKNFLGITYNSTQTLTTYDRVAEIAEDLVANGVEELNLKLSGWFGTGVRHGYAGKLSPISAAGGQEGLNSLFDTMSSLGINFYPDVDVQNVYGNAVAFKPGSNDIASLLTKNKAILYDYNPATFQYDAEATPRYALNPEAVGRNLNQFLDSYAQYDNKLVSLRNIGKTVFASYNEKKFYERQETLQMLVEQIAGVKEQGYTIMGSTGDAPFVKYLDIINDMPVRSSNMDQTDYSVPFTAMVLSGYVDYTYQPINLSNNEKRDLLYLIEAAAGAQFTFTGSAYDRLFASEFTKYYSANYDDVRDDSLAAYKMLAEAMDGIYGVRITKHERLADDVFQTTFENGNYVIVNYSDKDYTANGQTVKATDFVKGKAVGANGN